MSLPERTRGKFDLHLHTNASDGAFSPAQVVDCAAAAGLWCVAVTDHDTTSGVAEAVARGAAAGIAVLPGVELSADYRTELHLLGYGMNIASTAWRAFAAEQQKRRAERNLMMLEKLGKLGLTLPEEYMPSRVPGEYGRMHMALGLKQAGYVSDVQQAFDMYLGHRAPAYVKRRKFAPAELIRSVKAAGGAAVLAHPGRMEADDAELERLVFELKAGGIEGIEAYYPLHASEESSKYAALGRKAGLVCTYGSDWHGLGGAPACEFERFEIPGETVGWIQQLVRKSGGAG